MAVSENAENVVLSDLLFFIINQLRTHPVETIVEICDKFYDERTVFEEKTKVFNSLSKKFSVRRSVDKKTKDLEDIIHEMRSRDKSNTFLPVFAATNLNNIPCSETGDVTNSQIFAGLKDIRQSMLFKESVGSAIRAARNNSQQRQSYDEGK